MSLRAASCHAVKALFVGLDGLQHSLHKTVPLRVDSIAQEVQCMELFPCYDEGDEIFLQVLCGAVEDTINQRRHVDNVDIVQRSSMSIGSVPEPEMVIACTLQDHRRTFLLALV